MISLIMTQFMNNVSHALVPLSLGSVEVGEITLTLTGENAALILDFLLLPRMWVPCQMQG